jgi:hypothetical protein
MTRKLELWKFDPLYTNQDDPANGRYLRPLDNPEDEDLAHMMADWMVTMPATEKPVPSTSEDEDAIYEQAVIDSRRMLLDEDYMERCMEAGDPPRTHVWKN